MEENIFFQLGLVLAVAAAVSLLARLLSQPPVIGYIVAGVFAGPALLNVIHAEAAFESFSQIGIALLLFMVGLGLNIGVVRSVGKPALFTFFFRSLLVGGAGFGLATLLGLSQKESLLAALALMFSSTIIVVKALGDKKGLSRLYGQLTVGILLAEDLVASIALVLVSAGTQDTGGGLEIGILLAKAGALVLLLAIVGGLVMTRLTRLFATSQELLFLFSLAWTFGVASAFWWAGFSIEVGALFAGVALSHLPYAQEMGSRLKPLRDFFIILFFIGLGIQIVPGELGSALLPAVAFSALILFLKPIISVACLGLLGYTRQTGFKTSIHLTQISEFSIILVVLAAETGLDGERLVTIMTLTALITIAVSSYFIQYDDKIYRWLERPLSFFERADVRREVRALEHYPMVLLGYRKGGHEFVRTFRQMKKKYVVIDFDPDVVEDLDRQGINNIYGDATDLELLEEMGVHKSELVISTIGDFDTNRLILDHIIRRGRNTLYICHAHSFDDAEQLYEKGAAYVILPHFIGSEHISAFIREHGASKKAFDEYRKKHLISLARQAAAAGEN
jgi:Kef-type K+ transport system membrane component KefB